MVSPEYTGLRRKRRRFRIVGACFVGFMLALLSWLAYVQLSITHINEQQALRIFFPVLEVDEIQEFHYEYSRTLGAYSVFARLQAEPLVLEKLLDAETTREITPTWYEGGYIMDPGDPREWERPGILPLRELAWWDLHSLRDHPLKWYLGKARFGAMHVWIWDLSTNQLYLYGGGELGLALTPR